MKGFSGISVLYANSVDHDQTLRLRQTRTSNNLQYTRYIHLNGIFAFLVFSKQSEQFISFSSPPSKFQMNVLK